jgi:hypothetical protein
LALALWLLLALRAEDPTERVSREMMIQMTAVMMRTEAALQRGSQAAAARSSLLLMISRMTINMKVALCQLLLQTHL